jgi:hypothetical protein
MPRGLTYCALLSFVSLTACANSQGGVGGGGGAAGSPGGFGGFGGFGATAGAAGSAGAAAGAGTAGGGGFGATAGGGGFGATAGGGGTAGSGGGVPSLPPGCWNGPPPECNPLSNAGCSAGAACDVGVDSSQQSKLVCFPPPNPAGLGQPCDTSAGPYCVGGAVCTGAPGTCIPFCCSSADCGSNEVCTPLDPGLGNLGGCLPAGTGGAGGTGGSGGFTGIGKTVAECQGKGSISGTVDGKQPAFSSGYGVYMQGAYNVFLYSRPYIDAANFPGQPGEYKMRLEIGQPIGPTTPNIPATQYSGTMFVGAWDSAQQKWVGSTTQVVTVDIADFAVYDATSLMCAGRIIGQVQGLFNSNEIAIATFAVPVIVPGFPSGT